MKIHHVQVSIPRGEEDAARRFYGDALGLIEVPKPPALAGRGGCWFRAFDAGVITAEIHLGVDEPFTPAKKAHPGIVCDTLDELEALAARIEQRGTRSCGKNGTRSRATSASIRATASAIESR